VYVSGIETQRKNRIILQRKKQRKEKISYGSVRLVQISSFYEIGEK
jgi:hypothetical protein